MTVMYDVDAVRAQFPILSRVHNSGQPLIYLDNAATSQKPERVIEAMSRYYREYNSNVHRGIHQLSEEATAAYEGARKSIARFINAASWREVVFTRGTTESLNLVAYAWGRANLGPGDRVVSTVMEHHANIVPWQILAAERGFELVFAPLTPNGELDMDALTALVSGGQTRLLTVTHVSNVLGTVNPIAELAQLAHKHGALICVDGAQAVSHQPVDVQALDADFYAFSGHKMCGPTGIGVLYGRRALLDATPPFMGGGDMIETVRLTGSTFAPPPYKFEAGTPSIAEAVGLGEAVVFLDELGRESIQAHVELLTDYATERLSALPGVALVGSPRTRSGAVTFTVEGLHAHDVAQWLDMTGIAVRAGHHCAMPLHTELKLTASSRASVALYTTVAEIDALAERLALVQKELL